MGRREKQLMPFCNPPKIFVTPDKQEWTFLQTYQDFNKFEKFRRENMCLLRSRYKMWRFRSMCQRRYSTYNCQFTLLGMKNTKHGYHVYKSGEHNHPVNTQKGIEIRLRTKLKISIILDKIPNLKPNLQLKS
jgi:hypothetical protein